MFFDDLFNEYGDYEITATTRKSYAQSKPDTITIIVEAESKSAAEKKAKQTLKSTYVSHTITNIKLVKKLKNPNIEKQKQTKTKEKNTPTNNEDKTGYIILILVALGLMIYFITELYRLLF